MYLCGRKTRDPDNCGIKSMKSMDSYFRNGIPELGVSSMDPMFIEEVTLADIYDFQAVATNVDLVGLANYSLENFSFNADNQTMTGNLKFKILKLNSDLQVLTKIILPINEKGRLRASAGWGHRDLVIKT